MKQITNTNIVKILINISFFVFLLTIIAIFSSHVFAQSLNTDQQTTLPQQNLKISPIISELQLIPGKQTSFDLIIQNLSDQPVGIHADVSGFDETDPDFSLNQTSSILTKWTNLSENDLIMDAKETKKIIVTINTPANAKTSGYYETIFLTPFINQQQLADRPIVLSRIGALVFATVGKLNYDDLKNKVAITQFQPTQRVFQSTQADLTFTVKNSYFTHFTSKPFLTFNPLFGKSQQLLLEEKHVLPGKERVWQISTPVKNWNFYKANLAVSIGNGEQIFANTWFIVIPIPFTQIVLIFILIMLILFVIFKKDHVKNAIRILFGK